MLQCLIVGHAPWPLTHTAEPTIRKIIYSLKTYWGTRQWLHFIQNIKKHKPVHVLRMIQWSIIGLQLTVISKQWCALWCWADLSSGLNWKVEIVIEITATALPNSKNISRRKMSYSYCHISNISIFRTFHKNKSWISSVFNDNFVCNFPRRCRRHLKHTALFYSTSEVFVQRIPPKASPQCLAQDSLKFKVLPIPFPKCSGHAYITMSSWEGTLKKH